MGTVPPSPPPCGCLWLHTVSARTQTASLTGATALVPRAQSECLTADPGAPGLGEVGFPAEKRVLLKRKSFLQETP